MPGILILLAGLAGNLGGNLALPGVDLAGSWRYHVGDLEAPPAEEPAWPAMAVPSNWYQQGLDHAGVVWFTRTVELPAAGRWAVSFEGVDYVADVYWDGKRIGGHRGYFAPFSVEVGPAQGRHLLAVRVDSPKESDAAFSLHKTLIKGVLSHHDTRPGGAWSPRGQDANTGGIWGEVLLQRRRAGRLDHLRVRTVSCSTARARLEISGDVVALAGPVDARFLLRDPSGKVVLRGDLGAVTGARHLGRTVDVAAPHLWWPAELGDPALYTVEVSLRGPGGTDRTALPFGIRTVDEAHGRLRVNGVPIFLRGTNYIGGLYLAGLDLPKIEHDVALMRDAHVNAIRVHAHLLPRRFYDLADRLGLLVWQDFPLQWGYEDSAAFTEDAVRQMGEMIAAFGNHPSIAFWNGHNEAPWSSDWMVWKYKDYDPHQNRGLDRALEEVLARDGDRPFRANSHPSEHAWMGWYSGTLHDFEKPSAQPFLTEYGAQALPDADTLKTFLQPRELWPMDLPTWEYHNFQLHELRDIAKVPLGKSLAELVANTQRYQARLVQTAAESLRLQKWQPVGGIFQFMFVEHWPSMSWGVVDYLRRPKPGYRALARAYQPLLPVAARKGKGERLALFVINDRHTEIKDALLQVGDDAESALRVGTIPADGVAALETDLPTPDGELGLHLLGPDRRLLAENVYEKGHFRP